MSENELKQISEFIEMKLAREKAQGLIVTTLQATAPLVTRLVAEYAAQAARIAALEAEVKRLRGERWEPVKEDNFELADKLANDDRGIFVHDDGTGIEFYCEGGELEGWFDLPDGYAICRKVSP